MVIVSDIIFSWNPPRACWRENSVTEWSDKIMQFTGLKDKNGVEIYEGDIIQSPNTTQWVVEWDNWNSCFQGISLSVIMHPIDHVNCQVIGNIYENPELLTK